MLTLIATYGFVAEPVRWQMITLWCAVFSWPRPFVAAKAGFCGTITFVAVPAGRDGVTGWLGCDGWLGCEGWLGFEALPPCAFFALPFAFPLAALPLP